MCQDFAENAVCFAAICWSSSIRDRDSRKLNKLIKKAGSVLRTALEPLELMSKRRMFQNQFSILENTAHPQHKIVI